MQGFHNLESIIKVRADTVFLPLTWMPSSSLCRVSIASQCPRCERTLKGHLPCNPTGSVSITKERLVRNPQSWGPPQSYWLSFCILTGSPGDSYEHWRWNCATLSHPTLSEQNMHNGMDRLVSCSQFRVLYSLSCLSHWEERGNTLI